MEVPTSKGPVTVKFRGSMDRVDVVTVDGRPYGVVIDYKTGRTSSWYAKDMLRGTDLQLRLYLLVLHRFWGIMPVGALYFGFGDGIRRGAVRADFANRVAGLDDPAAVEQKAVKLLEPDEWLEFVNETPSLIAPLVDRLVRLDITPAPRDHDCGFCDFASICRYERWGAAE
jgi:ATP-dependent helicase/DNAse subunit B